MRNADAGCQFIRAESESDRVASRERPPTSHTGKLKFLPLRLSLLHSLARPTQNSTTTETRTFVPPSISVPPSQLCLLLILLEDISQLSQHQVNYFTALNDHILIILAPTFIPNGLLAPFPQPAEHSPAMPCHPLRRQLELEQSIHIYDPTLYSEETADYFGAAAIFLRLGCRSRKAASVPLCQQRCEFLCSWSLGAFLFPRWRTSVLGWTPSGPSAEWIMGRCRGCGFLVVVLFRRWAMSTVRRSASGVSVRKITPSRVCCIPSTFLGGWISTFEMSSSLLLIPFMACANSTSMSPFQHTPKMTPYTQMLLLVLAMRPGHPRPSLRASKLRRPSHGRRN